MTRANAALVAALVMVAFGTFACSSGTPRPVDSSDASAAYYDGPLDLPDGPSATLPLLGCAGPGYAANFIVGSESFQLTIDTGSGSLAVASKSCANCGVSPLYDPGPSAVDEHETTSDQYVLDSWQGGVYSDSVTLWGVSPSVTQMNLAAIDSQSGLFRDGGCAFGTIPFAPQGIVGFGPASSSAKYTDAFWTKLTASGAVPSIFAVEFCASGGVLMIGGVNPDLGKLRGPAAYTPLTTTEYYTVTLSDLQLSGMSLGFGASDFGAAAVDTGASGLFLPPDVFDAVTSTIESQAAFSTAFSGGTGLFAPTSGDTTTCLQSSLTRAQLDSQLPTLTLSFPRVTGGSFSIELPATQSYLAPAMANGTTYYCSGIFSRTPSAGTPPTALGPSAMGGQMVIFDLEDSQIGFAPQAYCP